MFEIGVVVPSWSYWANPTKLQPLWELYYATLIEDRFPQARVQVIDTRGHGQVPDPADLPACDLYFYWIMKSADAPELYAQARGLKMLHPKSVHMAGGTHVDHKTDECAGIFDTVFTGTAEPEIAQAIADWQAGRLEPVYRGTLPHPFSDYGHARRGFLPKERIVNTLHFAQHGGAPGTGAYFSRGCSFRCRFCIYNTPGKFEYRTGAQIAAELAYLKAEYGIQGVNLRDEVCVPVNLKQARDYIGAIGEAGVIWRGQTVPLGKEEAIALAAQSGCKELALGIESVDSDRVLEISNKPSQSIDANKRYIELLKKHGIKVKVCLIFGLPGESRHVVERTVRFLEEVQPDFVSLSGFDPVPGSPFHTEPEKYGIRWIDQSLEHHAHLIYRYGDDEEVGLPFEYEPDGPFGPALSRREILDNIRTVQGYLRDHNMIY
ncbi:MAG: radical SAM protein [Alphaproteobacteria bacterium]